MLLKSTISKSIIRVLAQSNRRRSSRLSFIPFCKSRWKYSWTRLWICISKTLSTTKVPLCTVILSRTTFRKSNRSPPKLKSHSKKLRKISSRDISLSTTTSWCLTSLSFTWRRLSSCKRKVILKTIQWNGSTMESSPSSTRWLRMRSYSSKNTSTKLVKILIWSFWWEPWTCKTVKTRRLNNTFTLFWLKTGRTPMQISYKASCMKLLVDQVSKESTSPSQK